MLYFKISCVYCYLFSCVYCCSCLVCIVIYVYLLYYMNIAVFTSDAGLPARSQYSEGPLPS